MHVRETGAGSPVVFIHGAGGSGQLFANQFQAFRDRFRCYFPDLPGHGKSPAVAAPGIQAYTDAILSLIQRLSPPVTLVGHSMGGAIALELALTQPDLVSRVVLSGTGCRLPMSEKTLAGLRSDYGATLDRIIRFCFSKDAPPSLLERARADMDKLAPEIVSADFSACAAFDACARASSLRIPALIVCGARDMMTPPSLSEQLHGLMRQSQLEIIAEGSHMVMLEQREDFHRVVLAFLQRS